MLVAMRSLGGFSGLALAFTAGLALFFGLQWATGRDNYGDEVNAVYLLCVPALAILLGFVAGGRWGSGLGIGLFVMWSQLVGWVLWPGQAGAHGDQAIGALAFLGVLVSPAIPGVLVGGGLRAGVTYFRYADADA